MSGPPAFPVPTPAPAPAADLTARTEPAGRRVRRGSDVVASATGGHCVPEAPYAVADRPAPAPHRTPGQQARQAGSALRLLQAQWTLPILFHLFGDKVQRYTDLHRQIAGVSQGALSAQLRRMEAEGLVLRARESSGRFRAEYRLSRWAETLLPALERILAWHDHRPDGDRRSELPGTGTSPGEGRPSPPA